MEFTIIALAITIINAVIGISSFVLVRKDKAIGDTKEESKEKTDYVADKRLLEYRLEQVEKKLDKILNILDGYEKEIDNRVEKAMGQHIKMYHQGGKNGA